MRTIHSDIIQFRGSHYDFGYMQGEAIRDSITVRNRDNQWKVRKPRFSIDVNETKEVITRFAPGIWDELLGLQEALEWPMEKVLQEFGGYRVDYERSGCSILTGDNYLIRNYDYHPKTYEGRYVFYQPTDTGYAMIGPSQRVTGRMDGMNEKGLAIGYNFMHRKNPGDGFICCMIGRLVLESAASVEEAVDLLKEIPHRHSFSYIVHDKSSQTFIIETSPRGVRVRQSNACTNHFEMMVEENRNHLVDSKRRLAIMEKERENHNDVMDAFRLLNDRDRGVFSDLYGSWAGTIHTSAYLPSEMKAWFALGGDREPIVFDFAEWMKGEDVALDRITGEVDTDIPFVHMDEGADWFKR
ncbi:C45 family autoproteolytic acyltransferase/hydrolase [Rossellomorea aquimaris]|uniref:C45 family autoproteolytic acyltransferase/hydolase n=1 Tax=Rossellomorea aquimaris TaxID=189382 RepID=UPI001CD72EFE|nr:C45 family peptidase [Rossellomorea aquimaris]MCA1055673.1 C45 family autoproteolytic acyltransferase/hydrolase [Rossellomorea aquimaris]